MQHRAHAVSGRAATHGAAALVPCAGVVGASHPSKTLAADGTRAALGPRSARA